MNQLLNTLPETVHNNDKVRHWIQPTVVAMVDKTRVSIYWTHITIQSFPRSIHCMADQRATSQSSRRQIIKINKFLHDI